MAFSRYSNRDIISINLKNETYRRLLKQKDKKNIYLHSTPVYKFDDTDKDIDFTFTEVYWAESDRLYKLSNQYYNTPEFWWVIAFFNQKPTDADYGVGDLVLIPTPLENALLFMGITDG